jgi:hypothetical protein
VLIEGDDDELQLQYLLDMGLQDEMELIQSVCVKAEKEYSLERALDGMMDEWDPVTKAHVLSFSLLSVLFLLCPRFVNPSTPLQCH